MKQKYYKILIPIFVVMVMLCDSNTNEIFAGNNVSPILYYKSLEEARVAVKDSGKPIVIDFHDDRNPSKKYDSIVFTNEKVVELFSNDMVLVKIHGYHDSNMVANNYNVRILPTIIIADSKGNEIDRIVGYVGTDEFIERITNYANGVGTLNDLISKANATLDRSMYFKIFKKYFARDNFTDATFWLQKVISDGDKTDSLSGKARFTLADMLKVNGDLESSITAYKEIKVDFKGSYLDELASINIPYLTMLLGDSTVAVLEFKKFIEDHPNSENVVFAKKMITELTK